MKNDEHNAYRVIFRKIVCESLIFSVINSKDRRQNIANEYFFKAEEYQQINYTGKLKEFDMQNIGDQVIVFHCTDSQTEKTHNRYF